MKAPEQRPVRFTWFIVVLTAMILACASTDDNGGGDGENTYATISKTKAVLNEWFSAQVSVYSNYVDTVEYHPTAEGSLPPGVYWDYTTSTFSGTPTQTGIYNVKVLYRDIAKGTSDNPNLADNMWYFFHIEFEVSRFQQPEGSGTCSVTFENTATWGTNVYVDGISVAWLEPGESEVVWVRAGTRVFQYNDEDGSVGNESVRQLTYGESYTMTLKID
jgi:hypothetical protein